MHYESYDETGRGGNCRESLDQSQEKRTRNGSRLHLELTGFAGYGKRIEEYEGYILARLE